MNFVKKWCVSLFAFSLIGGFLFTVTSPISVSAASCDNSTFLGFPAWYRGLVNDKCDVVSPGEADGELSKFIWHIVLNIVDMGFHLVAYIALVYVLYGGFMFLTSNGNSEKVVKGKNMLLNAVIGLVICIASSLIVNVVLSIMK